MLVVVSHEAKSHVKGRIAHGVYHWVTTQLARHENYFSKNILSLLFSDRNEVLKKNEGCFEIDPTFAI